MGLTHRAHRAAVSELRLSEPNIRNIIRTQTLTL